MNTSAPFAGWSLGYERRRLRVLVLSSSWSDWVATMNSREWPLDQTVFLVKHYTDGLMAEIVSGLSAIGDFRSIDAIHSKARSLELGKRNRRGDFMKKRAMQNHRSRRPLRAMVIELLAVEQEASLKIIVEKTGSTHSAVWKVCMSLVNQANAHIVRWDRIGNGYAMVIRVGRGQNAPKPSAEKNESRGTIPIPRPTLGAWGCVWNTTTPPRRHSRKKGIEVTA